MAPDADGHRRELLGPWEVAEDDSHLEAVLETVRALNRLPGVLPRTVALVLCTDPAEWLAANGGSGSRALRGP